MNTIARRAAIYKHSEGMLQINTTRSAIASRFLTTWSVCQPTLSYLQPVFWPTHMF